LEHFVIRVLVVGVSHRRLAAERLALVRVRCRKRPIDKRAPDGLVISERRVHGGRALLLPDERVTDHRHMAHPRRARARGGAGVEAVERGGARVHAPGRIGEAA